MAMRVGDRVLVAVTATCKRFLRDIDLFGRLGGEEFGMPCRKPIWTAEGDGGTFEADRRRDQHRRRKDHAVHHISIGVSVLSPEDDRSNRAEAAMMPFTSQTEWSQPDRDPLPFSRDASVLVERMP
jgi:GGDEF domain-containing protein